MFSKSMQRDHGLAKCEVWINGLQYGNAGFHCCATGDNHRGGIGGGQMRGIFSIGQKTHLPNLRALNRGAGTHLRGAISMQCGANFLGKFVKSDIHNNRKPSNQL